MQQYPMCGIEVDMFKVVFESSNYVNQSLEDGDGTRKEGMTDELFGAGQL